MLIGLPVSAGVYLWAYRCSFDLPEEERRAARARRRTRNRARPHQRRAADLQYHSPMPKIVDHDKRRDEIALVACRVVAEHGFEKASMVRIARGAGTRPGSRRTTFDSKQEIIIAALR